MSAELIAAFIGLGFVAWVVMMRKPEEASGGGEVSTEDGEGGAFDVGGYLSQAQIAVTSSEGAWNNPASMSADGLQALMAREGFSAQPYPDHKGYSIGYGHLIKPGEDFGAGITRAQAAELLAADVAWAEEAVRAAILVPISQSQFDALTSFAFNVGAGAFKRSTLVRRINAMDAGAADEFGRWIYASGQPNPGLVARRESERDQFTA